MFSNRKKEEPVEKKIERRAIVHITPVAIFIYECEGRPHFNRLRSSIDLEDKEGNYVGLSGTLMSFVIPEEKSVDEVLREYNVLNLDLPITRKTGFKEL